MANKTVLIVDDHPLFRAALKTAIAGELPSLTIAESGSFDEMIATLQANDNIELILLDLKIPGVQGVSGLIYLRSQYPAIPIAIVSGTEESSVMRHTLALGASGFIPKSSHPDEMRKAIRHILDGDVWMPESYIAAEAGDPEIEDLSHRISALTPQQMRVLMMLKEGLLNKQIAFKLEVSEATIKAHVSAILSKLNVDSRTQAVILASKIDGERSLSNPLE
jgi:DNA-binding NarL/FixJ family response regulator